jgi:hypothetical protein
VIFAAVSVLLIVAVYSPSVSDVFAAEYHCVSSPDKKTTFCYVVGTEPLTVAICTKDKNGHWKCNAYDQTRITSYIPPDLKNALDAAIQDSQNNTIGPMTDLLTEDSLFEKENTTDGNDIPKPPKDLGGLNDEDLPEPDQ